MASDATLSEARQGRHTAHGLPKKPPVGQGRGTNSSASRKAADPDGDY